MSYLLVTEQELSAGYHQWLMTELSKLGIRTADVSFLSLIGGWSPTGPKGKVLQSQITDNAGAFYKALAECDAKVIVPMGAKAFRAVTGRDLKFEHARGYVYKDGDFGLVVTRERGVVGEYKRNSPRTNAKAGDPKYGWVTVERTPKFRGVVIPTYDVTYLRKRKLQPMYAFVQDMRRAKRYVDGVLRLIDEKFDKERFFAMSPVEGWEPVDDTFAFDIETPMDSRDVTTISFSDGVTTMSLPWNETTREYARKYLEDPKYKKFAHNSMFDVPRLRDAGCNVTEGVYDTMLAGQLLQPDLPKALASMASVYHDCSEWKSKAEVDPYFYSAKDAFMECKLGYALIGKLIACGMYPLSLILMNTLPVLLDMHEKGIKVDPLAAREWVAELMAEYSATLEHWMNLTLPIAMKFGATEVDHKKPYQIHKLLYGWLGMEVQRNEDDGATVDAEALYVLKDKYPQHADMLDTLLKLRSLWKQYSTYGKPVNDMSGATEDAEIRVHPSYLPGSSDGDTFGRKGSASTGRLGVSNPNPQNQTKASKRMYVPDTPEHCFIEFDFSQAELRVLAARAGDSRLVEALRGDVHDITSKRLQVPRTIAKNTIYASCYLGGPKAVQTMMRKRGLMIPIKDIKVVQGLLKDEYTRMFAHQRRRVEEGQTQGWLRSPMGRVRYFYDRKTTAGEMADWDQQSTIAEIVNHLLPEVQRTCIRFGGRLVTTVHDSFLACVLFERRHEATLELKAVLERRFPQVAPGFYIPVDVKYGGPGTSWGDLVPYPMKAEPWAFSV